MKSFILLILAALTLSCGGSPSKKQDKKDAEPVLTTNQAETACDRIVSGELKIIRNGQTLWYQNRANQAVSLEVANRPNQNSESYLVYDIPPSSSQSIALPFPEMNQIHLYLRIDGAEWKEVCDHLSKDDE